MTGGDDSTTNEATTTNVDTTAKNGSTTNEDTTPPANITDLEAKTGNGTVILTWTNPTADDFFGTRITLLPETDGVTSAFDIEGQSGQRSSAIVNGLTNGKEYTFTLAAMDKNQNLAKGEKIKATPVAPASDTTAPADVTGLTVKAANGNAILTWTNPTDIDFAGVKISMDAAAGTLKYPVILEKGVETFTVSGLENGIQYTFKVQSFDKSLNFAAGTTEGATLEATPVDAGDTTPPADVKNLNVIATNGKAVLTWENPTDEDFAGLRLTMSPPQGNLSYPIILSKNAESFAVYELENGEEYSFTIEAFDESLNYSVAASYSATSTATPVESPDTTTPADVTNLRASATNGQAILAWENPKDDDFAGVKITMTPAAGTLANPVTLDKDVSTFTVSGLTNGIEYTFKIQSFDNSLNFAKGESEGATAKAAPQDTSDKTAPADVTDLQISADNGKDGKVNAILTWTDPKDDDLFGIEVTYSEYTSSRTCLTALENTSIFVAPGKQTAVITGLTANKNYTFTVKAMDLSANKSSGKSITETMYLKQLSRLKIKLTPSTTQITNKDVTVNVSVESSSPVSGIYFARGSKTELGNLSYYDYEQDITSSSYFNATTNGTYQVTAIDYDGRRETSYITISNIDKSAPLASSNLLSSYDYVTKQISINWTSNNTDVDYYLVSYIKAGESVVTDTKVTNCFYKVPNIEITDTEVTFEFTVKAVDKAGNIGESAHTSITLKQAPFITNIELSRNHFVYTENGTEFTATVKGVNFNMIASQEEANLKVQIVDQDNNVINYEAIIDVENNTATAILKVPELAGSATTDGKNYTVRAKICGEIDKDHTATFNISDIASLSDIILETSQISVKNVTTGMTTKATVTGSNLDVAGKIELALYNSTGTKYGDSVLVDASGFTQATTSFDVEIPIPTQNDIFTVKVLFDDKIQFETVNLQVYGVPIFTNFKIPNAGITAEDNILTATVIGKNFMAPEVTASDFRLTCAKSSIVKNAKVTIVNDTLLKVCLTIPGTAGIYDVTVTSESNSQIGAFTVKDYSEYKIGDIILKDGSKVDVANISNTIFETSGDKVPIAVVAGFNANGAALGLGLKQSDYALMWAEYQTTGYWTRLEVIETNYNSSNGYIFTGDCDGSDNWDCICLIDPKDTKDAATNYSAFNFAANYGTTTCSFDADGELASGWYIPSIAELYKVYQNKDVLQTSLTAAGGFTFETWYWSSSQGSFNYNYAYELNFSSGYVNSYYKDSIYYVLVVRAF